MRFKAGNMVFIAFALVVILGYAFEHQIKGYLESFNTFRLSDIKLETMAGRTTFIRKGYAGYVVFYSDINGCSACLMNLGDLQALSEIYESVGFFAVIKDSKYKQQFGELMTQYHVPGEYLVDDARLLENRLSLGDHPLLLFFNGDQQLIAGLPLDVEHEKLLRQYHRYIGEM